VSSPNALLKRTYKDAPGVDAFSLVDRIKVPVLGLYGEADGGIPATTSGDLKPS